LAESSGILSASPMMVIKSYYKGNVHFIIEALERIKGIYLQGERRTFLAESRDQMGYQMEFDLERDS